MFPFIPTTITCFIFSFARPGIHWRAINTSIFCFPSTYGAMLAIKVNFVTFMSQFASSIKFISIEAVFIVNGQKSYTFVKIRIFPIVFSWTHQMIEFSATLAYSSWLARIFRVPPEVLSLFPPIFLRCHIITNLWHRSLWHSKPLLWQIFFVTLYDKVQFNIVTSCILDI